MKRLLNIIAIVCLCIGIFFVLPYGALGYQGPIIQIISIVLLSGMGIVGLVIWVIKIIKSRTK